MTFTGYLPPKTMAFIVKLSDEYNLSWKEVQRILLNKVAFELGMECPHRRIGRAKSDNKPYCKDCWTRFKEVRNREYNFETKHWANVSKFEPIDTFLDELENKKNLNIEGQGEGQVKVQDREAYI
jgi:hypothetical protein